MSLMEWLFGKPETFEKVRVLQGRPVFAGTTIEKSPPAIEVGPDGADPHGREDRDRVLLGQTLIDTLVPYARNPAPFSTHELRYFTNQWIAAMSEDDRRAMSEILVRNRGKRDFNRRNR